MSQNSNLEDDEIDLRELFAALWSHKILIALFSGLSIFLAGNYVLTAEKKFTATAIFQIEETRTGSGFNIPGELSVLASLAGVNTAGKLSSSNTLIERTTGREFIIGMNKSFQWTAILF